jgi:hypothetical protein
MARTQLARAIVAVCRVPEHEIVEHAKWLRDMLLQPVG